MEKYVLYEDGKIKETGLPKTYKNISGFDNANEEFLNSHNWFKLIENKPILKEWQKIGSESIKFENNQVIKSYIVNDIPLVDYMEIKKNKLKQQYKDSHYDGFTCSNGIKLDCREKDKPNWIAILLKLQINPELNQVIKDYDNVVHSNLDSQTIINMILETSQHYEDLISLKWTVYSLIENSKSYEEIERVYFRKPVLNEKNEIVDYKYWGKE